jgi:hypothetical protein
VTVIVRQGATPYAITVTGVAWLGPQPVQTANKDTVYTYLRVHDGTTERWYVSAVVAS